MGAGPEEALGAIAQDETPDGVIDAEGFFLSMAVFLRALADQIILIPLARQVGAEGVATALERAMNATRRGALATMRAFTRRAIAADIDSAAANQRLERAEELLAVFETSIRDVVRPIEETGRLSSGTAEDLLTAIREGETGILRQFRLMFEGLRQQQLLPSRRVRNQLAEAMALVDDLKLARVLLGLTGDESETLQQIAEERRTQAIEDLRGRRVGPDEFVGGLENDLMRAIDSFRFGKIRFRLRDFISAGVLATEQIESLGTRIAEERASGRAISRLISQLGALIRLTRDIEQRVIRAR